MYLLIQLVVPLVLLARPAPRSTDFSWDMFSHTLSCSRLDVIARPRGGDWGSIRLDVDFGSFAQFSRVLTASRIEKYASYLCAKLREEERGPVELRIIAACREDRSQPPTDLVDPGRDRCNGAP